MKKFKREIAIPTRIENSFVIRSRQQSNDIMFAAALQATPFVLLSELVSYYAFDTILFPIPEIFAICYACMRLACARIRFVNEDREILLSQYLREQMQMQSALEKEESETEKDNTTMIPQGRKSGYHLIHVGLTQSQLEQIAKTGLQKSNLTVNYLESLGLSRQNAERLRAELADYNIVEFDDNERAIVTRYGNKVFSRILK